MSMIIQLHMLGSIEITNRLILLSKSVQHQENSLFNNIWIIHELTSSPLHEKQLAYPEIQSECLSSLIPPGFFRTQQLHHNRNQ